MENKPSTQVASNLPSSSIFSNLETFDHWQRVAKMISASNIVPKNYQGNVANTMIAVELANRIGISPFMVMQNLDIIQGKPSWNSTFIIAALNSCGRFDPMRFEFEGAPKTDEYGCRAITKDKEGNLITGPKVTWGMVKAEGWLSKPGSKWQTMPELMFQYRAASFFGRLYAPDILKGMHSVEEVQDFTSRTVDIETQEENEEIGRALTFIEKANTIEDLEVIEEGFPTMPDNVREVFEAKKVSIQKAKK